MLRLTVLCALLAEAVAFFGPHLETSRQSPVMMKRIVSPMRGKSKVVLLKDLTNIGNANEIVTVKDGFYMNYLLPR
jgi:hypothetical protein